MMPETTESAEFAVLTVRLRPEVLRALKMLSAQKGVPMRLIVQRCLMSDPMVARVMAETAVVERGSA